MIYCVLFQETQGVPVVTLSTTKDFPSFFSCSSGFLSPHNIKTSLDAAKLIGMLLYSWNI